MSRIENNLLIINELQEYMVKHPDLRFFQALWGLGIIELENAPDPQQLDMKSGVTVYRIIDKFYEEPETTLKKIKEKLENAKGIKMGNND